MYKWKITNLSSVQHTSVKEHSQVKENSQISEACGVSMEERRQPCTEGGNSSRLQRVGPRGIQRERK